MLGRVLALTPLVVIAAFAGGSAAAAPTQPAARDLRPIPLSELVARLLPEPGWSARGWSHAADFPHGPWIGDADRYQAAPVRVRIPGRTYMDAEGREIVWRVVLADGASDELEIGLPDEPCQGRSAPSCLFPERAWRRTRAFDSRLACLHVDAESHRIAAYQVRMPGRRRDVVIVHESTSGSAYSMSRLEIRVGVDIGAVCYGIGAPRDGDAPPPAPRDAAGNR